MDYTLVKIVLKNGLPTYKRKEIVLTTLQKALLVSKGDGGSVLIRKEHLKYKDEQNRENSE